MKLKINNILYDIKTELYKNRQQQLSIFIRPPLNKTCHDTKTRETTDRTYRDLQVIFLNFENAIQLGIIRDH